MEIMHNYKLLEVNLQLFNGAAAGGAAAASGGEGAVQGAESALPKAETNRPGSSRRGRTGEYDNVVFGKQDAAEAEDTSSVAGNTEAQGKGKSGVTTTSDTLEAKRAAFKEMIEGEYKDQYTEMFQNAFNRRFKEVKGMEDNLNAQKPIMDILMQRYNIADGDVSKLQNAIEQDNVYWESAAEEAGLTVEQFKAIKKLERENAELQRMRQRQQGEEAAKQRIDAWYAEGEKVKEIYPTFDFRTEVADRNFLGLLKSGLSVQQAYELQHMDEIKANAARVAAQTTGQQMAAKIQTKAARPKENGTSSQSAVIVKSDVHSLTKADRAEAIRRAQRGEKISF